MSRLTTDKPHRMTSDQNDLKAVAQTLFLTATLSFSPISWSETLYSEFEISIDSLKLDSEIIFSEVKVRLINYSKI
jgi:hypothetical protein